MEPRLPPSGDAAHLLPAPSLAQEVEAGGVEYKLMLGTADEARRAHLATQMRWRLREGSGRCVYYIGVMDNGTPVGLRVADAEASLAVLRGMAGDAGAAIESVLWRSAAAPPGDATGAAARRVLEVHLVRAQPQAPGAAGGSRGGSPADASAASRSAEADDAASKVEPRVALLGAQGAGKSSLVAALSQGILDDGNGAARMLVVRHRHELETGVTSSGVSWWTVGLDARGGLLAPSEHDAVSIASAGSEGHDLLAFRGGGGCGSSSYFRGAAARTLALLDLPGSQRYLKSLLSGLLGGAPDAALVLIDGGARDVAAQLLTAAAPSPAGTRAGSPVRLAAPAAGLTSPGAVSSPLPSAGGAGSGGGHGSVSDVTRTHLRLLTGLRIPFAVVVTHADALSTPRSALLAAIGACLPAGITLSEAGGPAAAAPSATHCPVLFVSCVSGAGLPELAQLLGRVRPRRAWRAPLPCPLPPTPADGGSSTGSTLSSAHCAGEPPPLAAAAAWQPRGELRVLDMWEISGELVLGGLCTRGELRPGDACGFGPVLEDGAQAQPDAPPLRAAKLRSVHFRGLRTPDGTLREGELGSVSLGPLREVEDARRWLHRGSLVLAPASPPGASYCSPARRLTFTASVAGNSELHKWREGMSVVLTGPTGFRAGAIVSRVWAHIQAADGAQEAVDPPRAAPTPVAAASGEGTTTSLPARRPARSLSDLAAVAAVTGASLTLDLGQRAVLVDAAGGPAVLWDGGSAFLVGVVAR